MLDCNTDEQIESARELALEIEVYVIKAMGSLHDIHVLNESRIAQGQKPVLGGRTVKDVKAKSDAKTSGEGKPGVKPAGADTTRGDGA